jgi:PAS domain S-box-containing protein
VVDADGRIVFASPRLGEQFGYAPVELTGLMASTLLPDTRTAAGARDATGTSAARSTDVSCEARGRHRDGSTFPVDIRWSPLETDNGVFMLAAVVDTTARRELEDAVKRDEDTCRDLERLIAHLSFQFMNLPSEQVIAATHDALRHVGEALEIDQCSFSRIRGGDASFVPTASWQRPHKARGPVPVPTAEELPWLSQTVLRGELACFGKIAEIPNHTDRATCHAHGMLSAVMVPLSVGGCIVGTLGFSMSSRERSWEPHTIHYMRAIAAVFSNVLLRSETDEALSQLMARVEQRRSQLQAENAYLRREVRDRHGAGLVVGQSPAIRKVDEQNHTLAAPHTSAH